MRLVQPITHRSNQEDLDAIRGVLLVQNLDGTALQALEHDRVPLGGITREYISQIIQDISQSGDILTISELIFEYIIHPSTLLVGAGKATRPSWDKAVKFSKTWDQWEDDLGPINCAAVALTFLMSTPADNYRKCPNKAKRAARELQNQLGWGAWVDLHQIGGFVKVYKKYKLVIFMPGEIMNSYKYTGSDYVYDGAKDILHVTWDRRQLHYAGLACPQAALRNIRYKGYNWCHKCSEGYSSHRPHTCEAITHVPPRNDFKCGNCGVYGKHDCPIYSCRTCKDKFKKGNESAHRCTVITDLRPEEDNLFLSAGDKADGSKRALIAYDLESKFNTVKTNIEYPKFTLDSEGRYLKVTQRTLEMHEHEANMVCYQVVFEGSKGTFYGSNCIRDFVDFLRGFNGGNNICIAHNASGYDTRLIFRALGDYVDTNQIKPIMRGSKILQLKAGKTVFRDSLLHHPASLKSLGKEMAPGLALKGFFPYLFNIDSNQNYVGPIPPLTEFGTSFRSIEERDELRKWHSEWTGPWDFRKELEAYCVNDVTILAKILEEDHKAKMQMFGLTPWLSVTTPSFFHHVVMEDITKNLEIRNVETDEYKRKIQHASENGFAVLKPFEYNFAMKAFRGGRTDNRVFQRKLTDEEIERGCRIVYLDVVSLYPYVQMTREYPVGYPEIMYWENKFAPCVRRHKFSDMCDCESPQLPNEGNVRLMIDQPTKEEILNDPAFNGFVCVTLIAPKDLVHAVLVRKDEKLGKCIASLADEHNREVYTSVAELKEAFKAGYTLVKVHRLDKYKFREQPWKLLKHWYIEKMRNSGDEPGTEHEKEALAKAYEKFDMGDEVRKSFGTWVSYI